MFATIKDLNTNSKYKEFIQAKTAWFENLVANNAFLNNLFSNQIILGNKDGLKLDNCYIQSKGYEKNTKGFRITANGDAEFVNLNAKKSVFIDCEYSGLLDCDVFKIQKKDLISTVVYFDTSQKDEFKDYYLQNFGSSYEYEGKVSVLYGENTYVVVDGQRYSTIRIKIKDGRATVVNFSAIADNGTIIPIYDADGSIVVNISFSKPYNIQYFKKDSLVIEMNDLPTIKPSDKGLVWNDNGKLSIS